MPVIVALLRGVNIGGHHIIRMQALRNICESLGLEDIRTLGQSGNVVFKSRARASAALARRLEEAIEKSAGFRPSVLLRTSAEMRKVVAASPFADRPGIVPAKLAVTFLAEPPSAAARQKVLAMPPVPEEMHFSDRELYIYFTNGMARPKLPLAQIWRLLGTPTTARNWNTVTRLLALAETMER